MRPILNVIFANPWGIPVTREIDEVHCAILFGRL